VTSVFSAYVTAAGQAWADFDVYMPERQATDLPRRRAAGIPDDLQFATKPELAIGQLERLAAVGLPARWAAADETSDAVKLSSCLGKFCGGSGEGSVLVVVLAGGQAVVQAAEEAAE
jgi:hypothetical protein